MSTRPNILIIMADQLAPQFCSAYGGPAIMPHLDALAARGQRFDAAYCNSPLCAPSRFSLMSGQLISRIAAYDNACEFPAAVPTFAHYLTAAGYRTCLSGKMHFVGPDQRHGFSERITTDIYPSDFAWTPDWTKNDERIDKWYHNMGTVKESGPAMATFQIDYDDEVEFAARRWLFDWARDGMADPFCMVASFIHPHDPYVARPEWWDLYDDVEIPLPRIPRPASEDPFSTRLMDGIEAAATPLSEAEVKAARRAYLANSSYFDSKIGALIQVLNETGTLDNTLVIVTSDHGDMLGERGLWYKMSFFEQSARVPFVMAGPGVTQGTTDQACSLVDLCPTVLEAAAYDGPWGMPLDGRSLMSLAGGGADPVDEAIGEYCAEMAGAPVLMIRRGALKYIHCDTDPPQLYDLESDPDETENVAEDPAYAERARAFADEVQTRWDTEALRNDVLKSQASRHVLHAVMEAGPGTHWDWNPPRDATQEYVRNHMDWTVAAARYRYPPREA